MKPNLSRQQKLFDDFSEGDQNALLKILESERPALFDYLLRMTGDVSSSQQAITLSEDKMLAKPTWPSLAALRFEHYKRCRQKMAASWNADVSRLENPSLMSASDNPRLSDKEKKKARAYSRLDRAIAACDAMGREVVLLHVRSKFAFDEISQILRVEPEVVEKSYAKAIKYLQAKLPSLPADPRQVIKTLAPHRLPDDDMTHATDLHELIGGLRRSSESKLLHYAQWFFIAALAFLAIIVVSRYFVIKGVPFWLKKLVGLS